MFAGKSGGLATCEITRSRWLFILLLLCFAAPAQAQESHGVVIHGDPRLQMLFKKKPAVKKSAARPPTTMLADASVAPATGPAAPAVAAVPEPAKPVAATASAWPPRHARVVSSGKGYRVQIYYGADRDKAVKIKTAFMRQYPGVRTYLSYISPNFRVKVGDYRNRSDAMGMLREANSTYNPSMIVPDVINISTY